MAEWLTLAAAAHLRWHPRKVEGDVAVRPDPEEGVVLQRQADHRRHRVLRRLGKVAAVLGARWRAVGEDEGGQRRDDGRPLATRSS